MIASVVDRGSVFQRTFEPDALQTDVLAGRSRLIPTLLTIATRKLSCLDFEPERDVASLINVATEALGKAGKLEDIVATVLVSASETLLAPRMMSSTNSFPEELPDNHRTTGMGIFSLMLSSILLPVILSGGDIKTIQAIYSKLGNLTLDQLNALNKLLTLPDQFAHMLEPDTIFTNKPRGHGINEELRERKANEILVALEKARIDIAVSEDSQTSVGFVDSDRQHRSPEDTDDRCLAVYIMADESISRLLGALPGSLDYKSWIREENKRIISQVIQAMIFNKSKRGSQVSWQLAISILDILSSNDDSYLPESRPSGRPRNNDVKHESTFVLDKLLTAPKHHFFDAAMVATAMTAHLIKVIEDLKNDNPANITMLDSLSRKFRLRFEAGLSPVIATMGVDINFLIEMDDLVGLSDERRQQEVNMIIDRIKRAYSINESRPGRVIRLLRKQLEQIIERPFDESQPNSANQRTLVDIVAESFYQALGFKTIHYSSIPPNRIIFDVHFSRVKGVSAMANKHRRPLSNNREGIRYIPTPEEVFAIAEPLFTRTSTGEQETIVPLTLERYRQPNGEYDVLSAKQRLAEIKQTLDSCNQQDPDRPSLKYELDRLLVIEEYAEFRQKLEPMIFDTVAFTLIIGQPDAQDAQHTTHSLVNYKGDFVMQEDFCENMTHRSRQRYVVLEIDDKYLNGHSFPFMKVKVLELDASRRPLRIFEMKIITGRNSRDEHWTRALRDYPAIPNRIIQLSQRLTPQSTVHDIANTLSYRKE